MDSCEDKYYKHIERVDNRKVLNAIKLPLILISYGWLGLLGLGLWLNFLKHVYKASTLNPMIKAITLTTLFLIPTLIWLYYWRKLAKYYRDKILAKMKNLTATEMDDENGSLR